MTTIKLNVLDNFWWWKKENFKQNWKFIHTYTSNPCVFKFKGLNVDVLVNFQFYLKFYVSNA